MQLNSLDYVEKAKNNKIIPTLIFLVLISLFYKDFIFNLNTKILFNDGDPALNLYFLKWGADYILGQVSWNSVYNLPVAFPFQNSLAFSDNLFGNQMVFLPYYVLTNNPLLSFNLWIITSYFLNYILMYLYIKNSKFISTRERFYIPIIGASIFTFSLPSLDLLGGHLQLLSLYLIPISLFILEKLLSTLKVRYFILFGFSISYQFYIGVQTGFILLVLLMLITPVYYIYLLDNKVLFFKRIWISIITFSIPTIVLLIPYLYTSKLTGHRTYGEVLTFIPSFNDLFVINIGEKAIFIGFPILLLFVIAILLMKTNKNKLILGIVILSFLFFLKEPHIFKFFFTYIPGFDSIRTPGRFILVSITLISMFIVLVLSTLELKKIRYIFFIFMAGLSITLFQINVPSLKYIYQNNLIDKKVLSIINHEATLIFPLYEFKAPEIFDIIRRMKDVNCQFPILDIYSGFNPTFVSEIELEYVNSQSDFILTNKLFQRMQKLGFKYILLEKDKFIHANIFQALNQERKFQKVYENKKVILYSYAESMKTTFSLNERLKNSLWKFVVTGYTNSDRTVFLGRLKGEHLSGVIQTKEEIPIKVEVNNKNYPCMLKLDKIKDSFSSFTCVSDMIYPEFMSMNKVLVNPQVKYQLITPYNQKTNSVVLKVTNTGRETWLAGFNGKYGLALSYKVENKSINIQRGYNKRIYLPYSIDAGKSFEIEIVIDNLNIGENIVTFSMVQELVTWFHDQGNKTLSIQVYKGKEIE